MNPPPPPTPAEIVDAHNRWAEAEAQRIWRESDFGTLDDVRRALAMDPGEAKKVALEEFNERCVATSRAFLAHAQELLRVGAVRQARAALSLAQSLTGEIEYV